MAYSSDLEPDQLTALTSLDSGDVFVVGDISDASEVAKYITKANLLTDFADESQTLTNKTLNLTSNTLSGTIAQFNTALSDADFATLAGSESLTNKKLGSLTTNGFVKTSGGDGTLSVDTNTYLTSSSISDTAYGAGWNGDTTVAPSKNAVYDEMELRAPKASPTFTGTVTLPTGLTGVIRADSGVVSTDSDVTDLVTASSDTTAGKVELATTAETNTGTDATRAVTPDGLAGSYAGTKSAVLDVIASGTALTTGDNKYSIIIPSALNGMDLIAAHARVFTAGTTGTTDIQLHNVTDAVDILSTKITIDSTETTSYTAATAPVINTSNDSVATGDIIRVDIDAISTTPPQGLQVILEFRLP